MYKKTICLLLVLSTIFFDGFTQSPLQFNYQAIARNSKGVPLAEKDISLRFSIRTQSETGTVEYMEIRHVRTNPFGMFSVAIGSEGARFSTGTLKEVKWEAGKKYLQVEMDPKGGNDYTNLGSTQLVSVPYALFSLTSLNSLNSTGGESSFSGAAGNGLTIEDSTVMLGGKEDSETGRLTSNRVIRLNGNELRLTQGPSTISFAKESITVQQDSVFHPDSDASGGSFLTVKPIFPRADAVPFLFNRASFQQHRGSVSPNEVVIWGHNLNGGGGPHVQGLPGIGYSLESNYKPTPDARWMESHEFYITPQGKQVRLKSYTIDTKLNWVDFFHSIDNIYLKNPRSGHIYFRVDNFGDEEATATQQISSGIFRLDILNPSKQVQLKSIAPGAELDITTNWNSVYLPGLILQNNGPLVSNKDLIPGLDNGSSLGTISNRFSKIRAIDFAGEKMILKNGWAQHEDIGATSSLDIIGDNGYNQLRLRKSYTPSSSADPLGNVGDFSWDENYIYIKTETGWKRTSLSNF